MIKIIKKKINMSDELKAKINWSCKFNNKTFQIIESYLIIVEHTNLAHVEPHKVIIKDTLYLFFNRQKHFYIGYFDDERAIGIKIEYLTTLKKYIPNIDKEMSAKNCLSALIILLVIKSKHK